MARKLNPHLARLYLVKGTDAVLCNIYARDDELVTEVANPSLLPSNIKASDFHLKIPITTLFAFVTRLLNNSGALYVYYDYSRIKKLCCGCFQSQLDSFMKQALGEAEGQINAVSPIPSELTNAALGGLENFGQGLVDDAMKSDLVCCKCIRFIYKRDSCLFNNRPENETPGFNHMTSVLTNLYVEITGMPKNIKENSDKPTSTLQTIKFHGASFSATSTSSSNNDTTSATTTTTTTAAAADSVSASSSSTFTDSSQYAKIKPEDIPNSVVNEKTPLIA